MLKLTVVTPVKKILAGQEVEDLFIPTFRGELNILPGHSALVATLDAGELRYKPKGSLIYRRAAISWGYCEVFADHVVVLAETAESPAEIDKERAQEAMKIAERRLSESDISPEEVERMLKKQRRALARLQVAEFQEIEAEVN